jgi:DNA-binding HxlR family transcriptional regulator
VEAGVVTKVRYCEAPERFEYHLSDAGKALVPILERLLDWGLAWVVDPEDPDVDRHRTQHGLRPRPETLPLPAADRLR